MSGTLDVADLPRVSFTDEDALIALEDQLPAGWAIEVEGHETAEWTAHVFHESAPFAWPRFLVVRWANRVGFGVQWMEGSSFTSAAFDTPETVLGLIAGGIFAGAMAHHGAMQVESATTARH